MELWERDSYKTPVKALFNHRIVEYDMKSANTSIAREFGLLPEKRIKELENLPKKDREIAVGLILRDTPGYSEKQKLGFISARKLFFTQNEILDEEVVAIKRDAIFVMKYVDKDTIAVNIDCIYSKVPRTDLPINNKVGNFKVVDESGLEIYFRGTNYAWRNKQGEQLSPHLRGIPKELQRTYNIEFGTQQREPDYIFNEKGEIVENESGNEKFTCENTREKL